MKSQQKPIAHDPLDSSEPDGRRRRRRQGALIAIVAAGAVVGATAQASTASAQALDHPASTVLAYTGGYQQVAVPAGATSVEIIATGGDGGGDAALTYGGLGARIDGHLAVSPGDMLEIGVGAAGENPTKNGTGAAGGWGGLWASGGPGRSDGSDYLRNSGGGGGATTVELVDPNRVSSTVLIAGAGGGVGGDSGILSGGGMGGKAGDPIKGGDGSTGQGLHPGHGGGGGVSAWSVGGFGGDGSSLGGFGGAGGGGLAGGYGGHRWKQHRQRWRRRRRIKLPRLRPVRLDHRVERVSAGP